MTGRIAFFLICMTILGTIKGCVPKTVPQMSAEDMQTCDDIASQWNSTEPGPSVPSSGAKPYLVIPAKAEITSPVYASILPFGPVVIQFKQPPADPDVSYRMLTVVVRTIAINGTYQEWLVGDPIKVVPLLPTNLEITWTPPASGKYIIMVLFSNVETIPALGDNVALMGEELQHMHWGDHYETYKIHNGASSLAYACVQIDPLKAVGGNTVQAVTMMPLENVTLPPTNTRTATPWPTLTPTLSPTPIIPTLTSTFTKRPPADIPTPVVDCRSYSNPDNCKAQDVCKWVPAVSRAPYCTHK